MTDVQPDWRGGALAEPGIAAPHLGVGIGAPATQRRHSDQGQTTTAIRRQTVLLAIAAAGAGILCLTLWSATRSECRDLALRYGRAAALAEDAQIIGSLRSRPRHAVEAGMPSADLLERVGRAMAAAGISAERLISSLPQPPRRLPGTQHTEVTQRLVFEAVSTEELVVFARTLVTDNPELHVTSLQLRGASGPRNWQAEVGVGYLVMIGAEGRQN